MKRIPSSPLRNQVLVHLLLVAFWATGNTVFAQPPKAFYIGHSLSDQIPDMVKSLSNNHPEVTFDWRYQWIPGAPLGWQWNRKDQQDYVPIPPHYVGFYDPANGLPRGDVDLLILTESVSRHWGNIGDTYRFADSFYVFAKQFNPNLRVLVYEVWHCLDSGTPTGCDFDINSSPWRQRLTDDLPMWESVVDTLNARFAPTDPVCLIPAGQGLAALHDSIQAGVVPGVAHIEDLFSDRIHLNDVGKYYIACIHFSVIHQKSPVGLTNQLQVWWGGNFQAPSPDLALKFQQMAWEVVNRYPKNCLGVSSITDAGASASPVRAYPNPTSSTLLLDYDGAEQAWQIRDYSGQVVATGFGRQVDATGLPSGLYYLQVGPSQTKFVKL